MDVSQDRMKKVHSDQYLAIFYLEQERKSLTVRYASSISNEEFKAVCSLIEVVVRDLVFSVSVKVIEAVVLRYFKASLEYE